MKVRLCSWFVGLALSLPAAAMAQHAYTTTAVNLRSGPDTEYPLVRWIPEGTEVEVQGCLSDYRWCDVEVYGERGWMYAKYLVYPYQSTRVPIITYGPVIGLPILGFSIDYWDDYYVGRPWYRDRPRWANHYRPEYYAPPHRAPQYRGPYYPPVQSRPPEHRPPQHRPPQYYPPGNPPEFRPPSVRGPEPQPLRRAPEPRGPSYRPPEVRPTPRPDYRPPAVHNRPSDVQNRPSPGFRPPEAARPSAPPQPRTPPGRDPRGLHNDAGERGGMTTGNF